MLQNATPLRTSAPGPPNISDEYVSCTAPATRNASLQILCKCPTRAIVFGNATKPSRFAHFWQGAESLAPATQNDIWTFKSGPKLVCFVHFDLEMCFAPQRRATFHLSSFLIWPHGSAPAALASVLFESFRHSGATNHYNNTVFRDFPTFSHICIFCLLTLSLLIFSLLIFLFSLPLPYSAFHLSILSEVWLLNSLCLYSVFHFCEINLGSHSYGHLLLVITGYFYGILHFINGVSLVLTTGILGHNCNSYPFFLGFYMVSYGF